MAASDTHILGAQIATALVLAVYMIFFRGGDAISGVGRVGFQCFAGVCLTIVLVVGSKIFLRMRAQARVPKSIRPYPKQGDSFDTLADRISAFEIAAGIRDKNMRSQLIPPSSVKDGRDKADICLVYVHGFKACPMDMHPLIDQVRNRVAGSKDTEISVATLKVRLSGHGLTGKELAEVTTKDLQDDMLWAVRVASFSARNVVFVGHSMGGALSTWLGAHRAILQALILISPCFEMKDDTIQKLRAHSWPSWARRFLLWLLGVQKCKPLNRRHEMYWVMDWPLIALEMVFGAVDSIRKSDLLGLRHTPVLAFHHKQDATTCYSATEKVLDKIRALHVDRKEEVSAQMRKKIDMLKGKAPLSKMLKQKQEQIEKVPSVRECRDKIKLVSIHADGDTHDHHVIAGDAFSPQTTETMADEISDFIREHVDTSCKNLSKLLSTITAARAGTVVLPSHGKDIRETFYQRSARFQHLPKNFRQDSKPLIARTASDTIQPTVGQDM